MFKAVVLVPKAEYDRLRQMEKDYAALRIKNKNKKAKESGVEKEGYGFKEDTELSDAVNDLEQRQSLGVMQGKLLTAAETVDGAGSNPTSDPAKPTSEKRWYFIGDLV